MKRRKKVCVGRGGGQGPREERKGGREAREREEWGEEKGEKWGEQMNGDVDQHIYLLSLSSFKFKQRSQEQA